MDSKRKKSVSEIEKISLQFYDKAQQFKPDLVFLGDDNAAKFLGTKLLDSETPVVFWGLNNTPVKYGLVDSKERPGHNITGVYQAGYYSENFKLLQHIAPDIKTFAILSDSSTTGRNYIKAIERLAQKKDLPLSLVETVITDNFDIWKSKALELQKKVDAFYIAHFASLRNSDGRYISTDEVIKWYIANITVPEIVACPVFVEKGLLCSASDPGFNQGYDAVRIAHDILVHGLATATYKPLTPSTHGRLIVNRKRAEMLGITLTDGKGIERIVEISLLD